MKEKLGTEIEEVTNLGISRHIKGGKKTE